MILYRWVLSLLQSPTISYGDCQLCIHPVVRIRRIVLAIVLVWPKPLKRSASIDKIWVTRRDRDGGEQTALKKQRVSLRSVYVWDVNSKVSKHSDYFVWKETSERVTRRWDDTSWQKASEFSCIKTPPFLREISNKKIAKTPQKFSLPGRRATNVRFSKFRGWHCQNKNCAQRGFNSLMIWFIRSQPYSSCLAPCMWVCL